MIAIFGPGGRSGKRPHAQRHEECAPVISGQVTLTLADEENTLTPGDAVTFPARAPHLWENRTKEAVEILMVTPRWTLVWNSDQDGRSLGQRHVVFLGRRLTVITANL
jgi:uncharacterized cupin superfamily protein